MKNDNNTSIQELKEIFAKFVSERDWEQFHTAKTMSMNLGIEVAELQRLLVWFEGDSLEQRVKDKKIDIENEVADIIFNIFQFCNTCNIDISTAVKNKLPLTAAKYPIDKCKSRNDVFIKDGKLTTF